MKPTVLLFDVDGTLLSTGGAGRRAIEKTFGVVHGRDDACRHFRFDGMTDRAIVRQGLEAIGAPTSDEAIDAFLGAYLAVLEAEVAATSGYKVHAGMREAVEAALAREGFAVGLGTGNIERGARVKLARGGLDDAFAFGGFGCDHEHRPTLIEIGARRGAERLGVPLASCRVVVVGDTPKDVAAAQAMGAESLGVGTGNFTAEALLAVGATWAFPSLASPGALEALLDGRRS
jgi:phosphoglycolate phosphatase-like HAD superfamily hydrolase